MNPDYLDDNSVTFYEQLMREAAKYHHSPRITFADQIEEARQQKKQADMDEKERYYAKKRVQEEKETDNLEKIRALDLSRFTLAELENAIDLFNDAIFRLKDESPLDFDHRLS